MSDSDLYRECRCAYYKNGMRCTKRAEVLLLDPQGAQVPGGWYCNIHGRAIVEEYDRVAKQHPDLRNDLAGWSLVEIATSASATNPHRPVPGRPARIARFALHRGRGGGAGP